VSGLHGNGGCAYPVPNDANNNGDWGMSLRDYFAGQALAGINANPEFSKFNPLHVASAAYRDADAMLKQREQ
jgi:hypothetical protein